MALKKAEGSVLFLAFSDEVGTGETCEQEDAFGGDVINSYNDGPTETGVVMGPFFEIETSSPGAPLGPGQSLTHTQYTMHLEGSPADLEPVVRAVFGVSLRDITRRF